MLKNSFIIVFGESATGKTTLAGKIAEATKLPLISKDPIKIMLFDSLGWKDRDWSRQVGRATYDIMDYFCVEMLKSGQPLILETTIYTEMANPKFKVWQQDYGFQAIQVFCHAEDEVVLERWRQRAASEVGHISGSEGDQGLEEVRQGLLAKRNRPLDLEGVVIDVDTTDFAQVDDGAIIQKVLTQLKEAA